MSELDISFGSLLYCLILHFYLFSIAIIRLLSAVCLYLNRGRNELFDDWTGTLYNTPLKVDLFKCGLEAM